MTKLKVYVKEMNEEGIREKTWSFRAAKGTYSVTVTQLDGSLPFIAGSTPGFHFDQESGFDAAHQYAELLQRAADLATAWKNQGR